MRTLYVASLLLIVAALAVANPVTAAGVGRQAVIAPTVLDNVASPPATPPKVTAAPAPACAPDTTDADPYKDTKAWLCTQVTTGVAGGPPVAGYSISMGPATQQADLVIQLFNNASGVTLRSWNPRTLEFIYTEPIVSKGTADPGTVYGIVTKFTADQIFRLFPTYRPNGSTLSNKNRYLQLVAFDPNDTFGPVLQRLFYHRGVIALTSPKHAGDILGVQSACDQGERYFLYNTHSEQRDKPTSGVTRTNATIFGFLYGCRATGTGPGAYFGESSSSDLKAANTAASTYYLALLASFFPKFAWGAINSAAPAALLLFNAPDSKDQIQGDVTARAAQKLVDQFCLTNPADCSGPPIVAPCDGTIPGAQPLLGSLGENPRRPPECTSPAPVVPSSTPTPAT
jgi:hypothetical protein